MRISYTGSESSYRKPLSPPHRVGDPVSWVPKVFFDGYFPGALKAVHGVVIYVNAAHRYYVAEADCNGTLLREGFKF